MPPEVMSQMSAKYVKQRCFFGAASILQQLAFRHVPESNMHQLNASAARQRFRGVIARIALAGAGLALGGAAHAGLVGLSSGQTGALFNISSSTGAATQTVNVTSDVTSLVGLEYLGGKFYATDVIPTGGSAFAFGTIDPSTGAFTVLNTQGGSANWHGLAGNESAGLLYSIDLDNSNTLVSVTTAGVITNIGATAPSIDGRGMAYDDANGILYATGGGNLWSVDTSTAAATLIGALGIADGLMGLAYDELTQTLYANEGNDGALYTVNVTTGTATLVGLNGALPAGSDSIDGLTWVPDQATVPEPSALALIALGLLALRRGSKARRG